MTSQLPSFPQTLALCCLQWFMPSGRDIAVCLSCGSNSTERLSAWWLRSCIPPESRETNRQGPAPCRYYSSSWQEARIALPALTCSASVAAMPVPRGPCRRLPGRWPCCSRQACAQLPAGGAARCIRARLRCAGPGIVARPGSKLCVDRIAPLAHRAPSPSAGRSQKEAVVAEREPALLVRHRGDCESG